MMLLQHNRNVLASAVVTLAFLYRGSIAAPASAAVDCEQGKLGAVAAESAVCSKIGVDVLKQGGNAADAVSTPILHG